MLRETPRPTRLEDYRPPEFLIDHCELHVQLGEDESRVVARLSLRRNPDALSAPEGLRLHGEGLELLWLRLDGAALGGDRYRYDGEGLTLEAVPDAFVLESEVRLRPQDNTALEGLYRSGGMFCTQCEAEGFRRITFFLDRPDVMCRFTTRIEADRARYPVLLSNGNPMDQGELAGGRHFVTWHDPFPKPSYLFALVAGDLRWIEDAHTTASGRAVTLRIYTEPENIDKCGHAMASLRKAMAWDEERYGREYDLDIFMIVAVNDFTMGAMENKGLNIFNAKYILARPETATDADFQGIEGVVAHEYFHNWTGNRITCRDWFQLSLKEGFTVYRDQEFSADMGSRGVKRIEDVRMLRAHQFAEDAGPMAHPVRPDSYIEINNFYTVTVYEKGAELVRMQANLLGAVLFRRATDLYFERHDGQAVTTDDFVRCMEDASGRDLRQFRRWYELAGTPELHLDDAYDRQAGRYRLRVVQRIPDTPGQTDKPPLHIPFVLGLVGDGGDDLPVTLDGEAPRPPGTRVLELRERETLFELTGLPGRPLPSVNRGFAAPVKVFYDYTDDDLMFLSARDSDAFNRWDASQELFQRVLLRGVAARADGREPEFPEGLIEAFRHGLSDRGTDPALVAEVLTLPTESYLGDQMEVVDVDGIHQVRETLKRRIAEALRTDLLAVYRRTGDSGDYDLSPESIGRRALRNLCLAYLMAPDDDEARGLCVTQLREGANMTDVIAALGLLAHSEGPERGQALETFYERWAREPLVLDKWLAVQARSRRTDTLARVRALMDHPAFALRNPNRVRSLIGAFAGGNPVRFHDPGGAGYRFLADRVLEIDRLNPQLAAGLVRVMTRWRRYDGQRQSLMKAQLERVMGAEGTSRDVYEVLAKSLA
ncbi:MAG: aminopeptidase N [Chromatiales bacterium]|jgi:aminopeptidase N